MLAFSLNQQYRHRKRGPEIVLKVDVIRFRELRLNGGRAHGATEALALSRREAASCCCFAGWRTQTQVRVTLRNEQQATRGRPTSDRRRSGMRSAHRPQDPLTPPPQLVEEEDVSGWGGGDRGRLVSRSLLEKVDVFFRRLSPTWSLLLACFCPERSEIQTGPTLRDT